MRTSGSNTLRGGQTVLHGLRMWGQLVQAGMFFAAVAMVAFPVWNVARQSDGYDWYAALMVTVAEAKLTLGYAETSGQEVRMRDGRIEVFSIRDLAASGDALRTRERLRDRVFASALDGAKASAAAISVFLGLFWLRGRQLNRAKRIRGAELATARQLRWRVRPPHRRLRDLASGRPPPCTIADVPFPDRAETRHTIVSGTTGSGKTVLISDLVAQIRDRGERCILYDKMGSYTRAFFDPGRDVLLNPLDARSPRWSPFHEARSLRDFDTMAAALIPQQKDTVDPFWVTAARQLFANGAGVLREKGVTENRVLVDHLLKTELTALAQAMEGTVAQSIVDPENPKTALSVRAMLTAHLGALEVLSDEGTPFSIRDWISDENRGGFLFLTSRADQHASLRGLISTWLEIAVNALLSLDQDDGRRVWIVLDELPTLHQVPSLQPGLAESRQFGGCFVLGIQVISALRDLYGRNGAETISGLCGTRAVLSAPDEDTARWSAACLGRAEVEEVAEGFSYGANTIRDGVSLTPRRELRPLALASEIMQLPALHGYLRFPGPLPAARIELEYVAREKAAERFVPRRDAPGRGRRTTRSTAARGRAVGTMDRREPGRTRDRGRTTRPASPSGMRPRTKPRPAKPGERLRTRASLGTPDMVASIGAVAAPSQGASYYERDGYYARDSPDHRQASAWAGRGAAGLGLEGPVDPDTFRAVLEGRVPDGSGRRLGRVGKDLGTPGSGDFHHRPGRDLTFSAPKSVSLAALVGGDARIVDAHDRAAGRAIDWFERNAAETRMKDPETGRMTRTGGQKTVIATFRHDASRNLDPALHTHAVIANMVQGEDGKWRTMANERLYASKMLLGAMYRNELAGSWRSSDTASRRPMPTGGSRSRASLAPSSRPIPRAAPRSRPRWRSREPTARRRTSASPSARRCSPAPPSATSTGRRSARAGWNRRRRCGSMPGGSLPKPRPARLPWRRAGKTAAEMAPPRLPGTAGRPPRPRGARTARRCRRRPRRPRPWPGRSRTSRSARRCSRAPICSPPPSPGARAPRRPAKWNARSRRWRRPEP